VKTLSLMEHLEVNEVNHLTLHGVDLVDLCEKYGTPLFVFDEATLVGNFIRFQQAFENAYSKVMVCYSIKTNNNLAICRILKESGAHAEVSSLLDLHVASKAGFPGEKIVYDGPFKPVEALEEALRKKVLLINCESFAELERLNKIAGKFGVKQAIGLRVNPFNRPSFLKSLHPKTLLEEAAFCFPKCRFGFSIEEARMAFSNLKKMENLRLECLMTHPYYNAISTLIPLFKEAYEKFGFEINYLNIGGGFNPETTTSTGDLLLALDYIKAKFGIKPSKRKKVQKIEDIAKNIAEKLKQSLESLHEPILITEPGRFIAGPAGILLLRVDHVKVAGGYKWVMVDGGTNIVPSFYECRRLLVANNGSVSDQEVINVVGPLLYPKDFIAIKAMLPKVKEGDVIAVLDCGAYSLSSSTQFLYPSPPAVLVNSEGKVQMIRERETYDDVIGKDVF